MNRLAATGRVRVWRSVSTSARMNSFHDDTKLIRLTVTSPAEGLFIVPQADNASGRFHRHGELLGVRAQRDFKDPVVVKGEALFASSGCAACHAPDGAGPSVLVPFLPSGHLLSRLVATGRSPRRPT